jgi:antitoxin component of MazEF toxin-antitoxin module
MSRAIIGRWGRALAVRLPASVARQLSLGEGGRVDVDVEGETIAIRKAPPERTLEDMFAGKSAREWRALYHDAYDWGPDLGREAVEA